MCEVYVRSLDGDGFSLGACHLTKEQYIVYKSMQRLSRSIQRVIAAAERC